MTAPPMDDMDVLFIDEWGQTITLRQATITHNTRGDISSQSPSDSDITAVVYPITGDEGLFEEGYVQMGDVVIVVKSSVTVDRPTDNTEYHFQYNSEWYKVTDVVPAEIAGTTHLYRVKGEKI